MPNLRQIGVKLDRHAMESLQRLSKANHAPYATIISMALACLENTIDSPASPSLAQTSGTLLTVYATLDRTARREWKAKVQALRAQGESYAAISKILFTRYGLTGADGFPLGISTLRGMAAM